MPKLSVVHCLTRKVSSFLSCEIEILGSTLCIYFTKIILEACYEIRLLVIFLSAANVLPAFRCEMLQDAELTSESRNSSSEASGSSADQDISHL
jgi:hypothetical protein